MGSIAVCNSTIVMAEVSAGGRAGAITYGGVNYNNAVPLCTTGWVIESYTLNDLLKIQEIDMYTHAIFDLLFVAALSYAFFMGFHKGGQR